jgi:hypothetical protein
LAQAPPPSGTQQREPPALTQGILDKTLAFAEHQVAKAARRLPDDAEPVFTLTDGRGGLWIKAQTTDWRAGFFDGLEWLMFETFGNDANDWLDKAKERMAAFADEVARPQSHDVGFKTLATYGNGYRLTNNPAYIEKIFAGADTLAARFLPEYGVTRSWDDTNGDVRVIVDNMMNLEVLFLAASLTPSAADRDRWLGIAISHANKTVQNQVRTSDDPRIDGGTCHVYFYNLSTCRTRQGLNDSSTWARGQAWAMHGFTTSYEFARHYPQYQKDATLFLSTAARVADNYLRRLAQPQNGDSVPLHDFDAPAGYPKDSSAAAIAASALLELSILPALPADKREVFKRAAERTLLDLSDETRPNAYRETAAESDSTRETILLRATTKYKGPGNIVNTDVEKGLVYADYYFVEALLRYRDMYGDAPRAPTFLDARAGGPGVMLSWRSTRGAQFYRVRRTMESGRPFAVIATTDRPFYLDVQGLPPSRPRYVVTAVNQVGKESPASAEVDTL